MDSIAVTGGITGPIALLKKAWQAYKANFKTLTLIALVPALLTFLVSLILVGSLFALPSLKVFAIAGALFGIVAILIQLWSQIALIITISDPSQTTTWTGAYKRAWGMFWPYVGLSILTMLVVGGGAVLFIIPGFFAAIAFSLASFSYANENVRGLSALRQSAHYVKGFWWAVFGRLIVLAIVSGILFQIPLWIFGEDSVITDIVSAILSLIIIPVGMLFVYFIYSDLKALKATQPAPVGAATWMKAFLVLGIVAVVTLPVIIYRWGPKLPYNDLLKLSPDQVGEFGSNLEDNLSGQNFEGMSQEQIEAELQKAFEGALPNPQ